MNTPAPPDDEHDSLDDRDAPDSDEHGDDDDHSPRILVAIALDDALELDPRSRRVADQALWLAERCDGQVRFMHVIDSEDDDEDEARRPARLERIEALLKDLCHQGTRVGLDTSAAIAAGRPPREILHEAWHWPADLLVVGPHLGSEPVVGDRGLRHQIDRLVHGSTAHHLLRKAPCAVWVVSSQGPVGIERAMVVTDLGRYAAKLISLAERMHDLAGVECVLMYCMQSNDLALNMRADARAIIEAHHDDLAIDVERRVHAVLGERRAHWTVETRSGSVDKITGKAAEQLGCDLVIIGSSATNTIGGSLLGDTTSTVVDRFAGSTWIVRTLAPTVSGEPPRTRPLTGRREA